MKKKIALSWSGGKDGCMALHKLIGQGHEIACLITTVPVELERTFGHGEKMEAILKQSEALGIPVHFIRCTFKGYTQSFIDSLKDLKKKYHLTSAAFGDLYLDEHRSWGENAAESAGLEALYPLWMKKDEAPQALHAFADSGYKAVIIRTQDDVLDGTWLGQEIDQQLIERMKSTQICPMGEAGEYHTFVYDGPLFKKLIQLQFGERIQMETTTRLELEDFSLIEK
ncbi:diphthine--ammonia ligase [Bacillus sp. V2I10]|uniref:Dph6-related ATP pyrophosphatase n=1 Tax=Bacillus sp. V2I10 TaxID=3042276 RepID=UPI002781284F|nr:diphthine--ammonia ligase [Bacillus sp. V2I10]MDQ0859456.1 diphthine-ammonia ligase [Bacillus sp. V2I10]